jgi:hypothetical protein
MSHSTAGLQIYSNLTDNKIGHAVCIRVPIDHETSTYYEYDQLVQFRLDVTNQIVTQRIRWRKPKDGYRLWQFSNIENNNTGLVTVNCAHIMNGVYPNINSIHKAKIGGRITTTLQPASIPLNVVVTKIANGDYNLNVNGGQFNFLFEPDSLTSENANEIIFTTE